jgi:hypothetical protein
VQGVYYCTVMANDISPVLAMQAEPPRLMLLTLRLRRFSSAAAAAAAPMHAILQLAGDMLRQKGT